MSIASFVFWFFYKKNRCAYESHWMNEGWKSKVFFCCWEKKKILYIISLNAGRDQVFISFYLFLSFFLEFNNLDDLVVVSRTSNNNNNNTLSVKFVDVHYIDVFVSIFWLIVAKTLIWSYISYIIVKFL